MTKTPFPAVLTNRWATGIGLVVLFLVGCRSVPKYIEPPPASYESTSVQVEIDGTRKTITGAKVGNTFFQAAGMHPLLGRTFASEEYQSAAQVIVVSERLWRDLLRGDPSSIGKQIGVNGQPHTIIGVMPASFDTPTGGGLWTPGSQKDN